jgi:exodeoxyribonuclease V gamma subunit
VLPPGRAGDEAWIGELDAARALVAVAAQHELFAGGRPSARPLRVEQTIATAGAPTRVRGELRRVFDKNGALWVAECYLRKSGEGDLDFKSRIPFFIEWALLRLATPAQTPVRACVVLDGKPENWQRSFDAWEERRRNASSREAAELHADIARRVAGLVEFWRRSQFEPQWYFPVTSWTLLNENLAKARERWFGGAWKKMAERDYAPGYADLLARDNDLFEGANLVQMQANARALRALIDLDRPLKDDA